MKRYVISGVVLIVLSLFMQSVSVTFQSAKSGEQIYENRAYGYTFNYSGFTADTSNEVVKTTFTSPQAVVDIYYDDFSHTIHNSDRYVNYSNKNIKETAFISQHYQKIIRYKGNKVLIHSWKRPSLQHFLDDRLYYLSMDIIKNENQVVTLYIRSSERVRAEDYLDRLAWVVRDPHAPLTYQCVKRKENPNWSPETKDFFNKTFVENDTVKWGIFEPSSKVDLTPLRALEESMSTRFQFLLEYYNLDMNIQEEHLNMLCDQHRTLELTFQTSYYLQYDPDMIYRILDGELDDTIGRLAGMVAKMDAPVLFRLNNEMNGDWCPYNAWHYQKDTALFRALWRYFYDQFEKAGADQVIFVWNPNEKSFPSFSWNHYMNYYPGERYVDIIGVTGYNTGNYYAGETWRSFKEIYDAFMPDYKKRFQGYDFYITEFGSSTHGGDRNQWLDDMFDVIDTYGIKAAIYWNGTDWDGDIPARIYRIDDDPLAQEVFWNHLN